MNKKLDKDNTEMSPNKTARIAGFLFLILGICTGTSWAYLKSIYVPNDALTTVNNIQASGWLYRLNFVSNLIGLIALLFSSYFLYKLLKSVNKDWARLMVLLVVVSTIGLIPQITSFKISELEDLLTDGNFEIVETECLHKSGQKYFVVAKKK